MTINSISTNKIPKLVIDEYYSKTEGNWISEIISDYYGTNVCSKTDFTHGLYIKLGRERFNNLIVLNNDYSPIARISKEKGHWFNGSLTIDNGVGKSTIIYSEPQSASPTDNAQTVIKGINFTHKLILRDTFAGGCNYAVLSGGYTNEGTLMLRSFNVDTINNTASVKATTTISTGDSSFVGTVTARKFITREGTSSQFVKGDGSLDSNTYATTTSLDNYVTLNGTQTITGVKTFSTQQKFTVAQGTSPFTVTSTTKVSNLNSDLLDGYDSSRFLRAKDWVAKPGQDADTLEHNMMGFTYSNNAPHTGTIIYFAGTSGGTYGL